MLDPALTSVICPRNDLESATILELAETLGCQALPMASDWGLRLDDALGQLPAIDALREQVVAVQLPAQAVAERIRASGRSLHLIDHPDFSLGADGFSLSSLEQFARLLGHELTTAEWEVAIADRDFFPGLSAAGVPLKRARALREREREVCGDSALMAEAQSLVASVMRRFGRLWLLRAPHHLGNLVLEAAQRPGDEPYSLAAKAHKPVELKRVLVLLEDEDGQAAGIRFAGEAHEREMLRPLLGDAAFADLSLWLGGGRYGCFFGADAPRRHPGAPVSTLMSRLLALVLGTDRPILGAHTGLLLPLDLHEDKTLAQDPAGGHRIGELLDEGVAAGRIERFRLRPVNPGELTGRLDERALETQTQRYFLPQLQDVVVQCEGADAEHARLTPIHRWRLPREVTDPLSWQVEGLGRSVTSARIRDCSLYGYYNGLYILAIQLEPEPRSTEAADHNGLAADDDCWWRPLFDRSDDTAGFAELERLRLDHWLRFTQQARILFPQFIEQAFEDKIDDQALCAGDRVVAQFTHRDDLSPILLHLLAQFLPPPDPRLPGGLPALLRRQQLNEARVYVNCAYALAGVPPADDAARAEAHRLFSLALYVDGQSDTYAGAGGYAYDRAFVTDLMDDPERGQALSRWCDVGTWMGFGPYSNAYLGYGGFFRNVIAAEHVPYPYERMLLLALFYLTSLRSFNRRINHASNLLADCKGTDPGLHFRQLRESFIRFTNTYWFREVTPTIQGGEIFARQVRALGLEAEYQDIKDEMERADEYVQSQRDRIMNERMGVAGWLAAFLAVASLAFAAFEPKQWGWILVATGLVTAAAFFFYRMERPNESALPAWLRRWLDDVQRGLMV